MFLAHCSGGQQNHAEVETMWNEAFKLGMEDYGQSFLFFMTQLFIAYTSMLRGTPSAIRNPDRTEGSAAQDANERGPVGGKRPNAKPLADGEANDYAETDSQ